MIHPSHHKKAEEFLKGEMRTKKALYGMDMEGMAVFCEADFTQNYYVPFGAGVAGTPRGFQLEGVALTKARQMGSASMLTLGRTLHHPTAAVRLKDITAAYIGEADIDFGELYLIAHLRAVGLIGAGRAQGLLRLTGNKLVGEVSLEDLSLFIE